LQCPNATAKAASTIAQSAAAAIKKAASCVAVAGQKDARQQNRNVHPPQKWRTAVACGSVVSRLARIKGLGLALIHQRVVVFGLK
jgi:hypothetical protein